MQKLKYVSFGLFIVVIVVLGASTIANPLAGTDGMARNIYGSWWFVGLWGALALCGLAYIVKRRLWRLPITLLLHLALLVILAGALTTHLWGEQGSLSLRQGESTNFYVLRNNQTHTFPFSIRLDSFVVNYHGGTTAAQDYISRVSVTALGGNTPGEISMNNVFTVDGYRFYQSGYDPDQKGSMLSVCHDPWGIRITYAGYAMLLIALLLFFLDSKSMFWKIWHNKGWMAIIAFMLLSANPQEAGAQSKPKTIPPQVARQLSNLYVYYNERICPMDTYAKDFTLKLYGKSSYRGMTPVEVLAGWMFYYDDWAKEPIIRIKGDKLRQALNTAEGYVTLQHFYDAQGRFRLAELIERINRGEETADRQKIVETCEKINIIERVRLRLALQIFPTKGMNGGIRWVASGEELPHNTSKTDSCFIRQQLDCIAKSVASGDYAKASRQIEDIASFQYQVCGGELPTVFETQAERLYNSIAPVRLWAMACLAIGIVTFIGFALCNARGRKPCRWVGIVLWGTLGVVWLWLTTCIALRTLVSHHLPLTNGFETMQAMAWSCFTITAIARNRIGMALPFGFIVGGLALLVAMIGESNPRVTNLMPVLNSPLLSIHVMVIMVAYALLAFVALNGIVALCFSHTKSGMKREVRNLTRTSLLMLYPAVFLLTAGIFIGAVWANVSWGRYWGWDPKEVWALITMMLYVLPLHRASLKWMTIDRHFHLYSILAFLAVIMTYVGVNFFLPGMHSYA